MFKKVDAFRTDIAAIFRGIAATFKDDAALACRIAANFQGRRFVSWTALRNPGVLQQNPRTLQ